MYHSTDIDIYGCAGRLRSLRLIATMDRLKILSARDRMCRWSIIATREIEYT